MLPVQRPVLLDEHGFLLPVSDNQWCLGEYVRPTAVSALPGTGHSFAVLAAAGAGKTTTCKALSEHEPNATYLNAAPLTRDNLERKIGIACGEQRPVYLDGLDQAVLHDPRLLQWLEEELTTEAARSVPWRLACRSAAWEASLTAALKRGLPGFDEWKLLPLDRATAESVVSVQGYDGVRFIEALIDARLGRLSACAGQLLTTARYWTVQGRLPAGSVEAMQFEIDRFLAEPNTKVRPRMPLDQARRIAKRLGAFTVFSGTQALSLAPAADEATLSVDRLPSGAESIEPTRPITPEDYGDVLGTALFDPGAPGVVTFRHQMYAEYLAAAYLVDRDAAPEQVADLLGTSVNGVLPPSRIGVASWLAALKPRLVEQLIADNVTTFAFSAATVELTSDTARAAVVEALLDTAARDDQMPESGLDLKGLVHSALEDQLSRHLVEGPATSQHLWWLARLAVAGQCTRLASAFADAAQDRRWYFARRGAIIAADRLGDDTIRCSLRSLLDPDPTDEDNQVYSTTLDVLYPRLLSTDDLSAVLRPHRSTFHGNYRRTLHSLADRIPEDDLARFISAFAAGIDDDSDLLKHYYDLPVGLIRRAWQHADHTATRQALAQLLAASVRSHYWHRVKPREAAVWIEGPVDRRRALAIDLAGLDPRTWYAVISTGLLIHDDVPWLLDRLPALPVGVAETLIDCLPQLLLDVPASTADLILTLPEDHPAYAATDHLRGAVDVNSSDVAQHRKLAAEDHAYEQGLIEQRTTARRTATELLNHLDAGPTSWWQLTYQLAEGDSDPLFGEDLTQRPGWQHLTEEQRHATLLGGLRYLHAHTPDHQQWCGLESLNPTVVVPDWEGVRLLSTLAYHAPAAIADLDPAVWATWSHSIIATWVIHPERNITMRGKLLDVALDQARQPVLDAALSHLDDLEAASKSLSPEPVYRYLAPHLADDLAHRLLDDRYSGELARGLLDLLAQKGPTATALETCLRLTRENRSALIGRAQVHLAALAPNTIIDELAANPPTADTVAGLAQRFDITRLDHTHLVKAAAVLLTTHPYADDDSLRSGYTDSRHHAQNLRIRVLRQLADTGSVDELVALRHDRPELDQRIITTTYLRTAKTRQAELTLARTTPQDLLELLRSSDARLVHDDADLVKVVLRQLDKLQHTIKNQGAFRDIWNGNQPQTEDDISDWIGRRCEELLASGVVVNREVHVVRNRDRGGIGTRIDLTATAHSQSSDHALVAIEAKRSDNHELLTAMSNQLIDRYLIPIGRSHGVYLAYWITPEQRPQSWSRSTFPASEELLDRLRQQANDARNQGMHIAPYVLDISRPRTG
ncbi:hypothetical protein ALI22I_19810 [Saccharothrix sp. ALI-22-I]|nr:hypothetical protein ALI22I_19810 [Saccharothrix sp. ALI-22-I]